jgi:hypothetical protein
VRDARGNTVRDARKFGRGTVDHNIVVFDRAARR